MILLDTTVLTELLGAAPQPQLLDWLASRPRSALFTCTITRAELFHGLHLMAEGPRRDGLFDAVRAIFEEDFSGQVLSFDSDAADSYARIAAARRLAGRPIRTFDAMVAAVARSRGASLATRNGNNFIDCGVNLIDPWSA